MLAIIPDATACSNTCRSLVAAGAAPPRGLERAADRSVLAPLGGGEGRHRPRDRPHGTQELGASGGRRHNFRSRAHRAGGQDARDEDGQDRARLSTISHSVQPRCVPCDICGRCSGFLKFVLLLGIIILKFVVLSNNTI
jgi:hypothetical protein